MESFEMISKLILLDHYELRVVQTQAILFLKLLSERVGSDIQRRRNRMTNFGDSDVGDIVMLVTL